MNSNFIKNKIIQKIDSEVLNELVHYFIEHKPKYRVWGLEKPTSFYEDLVYLALYKDLYNVSYGTLARDIDYSYTRYQLIP